MDYIDLLYQDMMARNAGRAPAGFTDPNAVLNPLGAEMPREVLNNTLTPVIDMASPGATPENPQKQPIVVIEGDATNGPVIPTNDDPKTGYKHIINYTENVNPAINLLDTERQKMSGKRDEQEQNYKISQDKFMQAIQNESGKSEPFVPSYDYAGAMKKLSDVGDIQGQTSSQTVEPNLMTELIKAFGAPLLGMATGESGQLAQVKAQEGIRKFDEQQKKDALEREKLGVLSKNRLADEISKRMVGIRQMQEGEYKVFADERKFNQDKLTKIADRLQHLTDKDQDQLKDLYDQVKSYDEKLVSNVMDASKEVSKSEADEKRAEEKIVAADKKSKDDFEKEKFKQAESTKRAKIIANGLGFKDATNLRKEFLARPEVKNFADVSQSYEKIKGVAAKPSAAGDISLIFSYMKMLDPGSVVREGEQATAQNAAGVSDQLRNHYNRVINGERLTPKQRNDFINQAGSLYNAQQGVISKIEKEYRNLGTSYGTQPGLVVPNPSTPLAPKYKDGETKNIKGQVFVRKDGKWVPKK